MALSCFLLLACLTAPPAAFSAQPEESVTLDELIAEGLRNSPEILAATSRADAAGYRIPQAKSLPDPMFMFGYQNEGFDRFTLGRPEHLMSQGISSLSQQFYFPGKTGAQGGNGGEGRREPEAALSEAQGTGWPRR